MMIKHYMVSGISIIGNKKVYGQLLIKETAKEKPKAYVIRDFTNEKDDLKINDSIEIDIKTIEQIKIMVKERDGIYHCPICKMKFYNVLREAKGDWIGISYFCPCCGQALDWPE